MTPFACEWWQQGLFEWRRQALQGRRDLATPRVQYQAPLLALEQIADATALTLPDKDTCP